MTGSQPESEGGDAMPTSRAGVEVKVRGIPTSDHLVSRGDDGTAHRETELGQARRCAERDSLYTARRGKGHPRRGLSRRRPARRVEDIELRRPIPSEAARRTERSIRTYPAGYRRTLHLQPSTAFSRPAEELEDRALCCGAKDGGRS